MFSFLTRKKKSIYLITEAISHALRKLKCTVPILNSTEIDLSFFLMTFKLSEIINYTE